MNSKIRIAFFADLLIPELDGATRTMFQLISRIPDTAFEFLFICGSTRNTGAIRHRIVTIPSVQIPINKSYRMALPALAVKQLNKELDDFMPQVVHIATPSLLGHFALGYAKSQQIPVITIYHTHFISYLEYYLRKLPFLVAPLKKQFSITQTKFYNDCSKVYVPSGSIAHELTSRGISAHRIQIWQRGINTRIFSPLKKDHRCMERICGNTHPTILFASRLVWEKNLHTLIDIYHILKQDARPYNFLIVGDGVARRACQQKMPEAIFTGNVDQETLSVMYASSSVFVFPSVTETFGSVVLEAMASGLPCVIADEGGSKDFISDGMNGFRCDRNRPDLFADRIRQILENPKLASRFSQAGLVQTQLYNWDELAAVYFNDLKNLSCEYRHHIAS